MDKKKKKILVSATAGVLAAAIAGGTWFGVTHHGKAPVYVFEFMNVGMTEFWGDKQESYGPVSTDNIQTVFLSDTQDITDILVKEGDQVKKGDLLMTFDTTLSDIDLERKRLEVEKLKLQLEDAKKELREINQMKPMQTPPEPDPELPPEEQNLGPVLPAGPGYEIYGEKGKFDGSSAEKPLLCWVREEAFLTDGLVKLLLQKAAEYQTPDPTDETVPGETQPGLGAGRPSAFQILDEDMAVYGEAYPGAAEPQLESYDPMLQGEWATVTARNGIYVWERPDLSSRQLLDPENDQQLWELQEGDRILVFEQAQGPDDGVLWIRLRDGYYMGWIQMDGIQLDRDVEEQTVPPTTETDVPPTTEPIVPPTTETVVPPTTEPIVPPTTETDVPPTTEPIVPPTTETVAPPTTEPIVPPTTEPVVPPTTEPVVPPTDPTVPDQDLPTTTTDLCYVVFKVTEQNTALGNRRFWQGMQFGRDYTFKFFDAAGIPDISIQEMQEDEENFPDFPEFDFGSGMTAAQIAQMRDEQKKKIKDAEFSLKMAEAEYKIKERELMDGNIYADFDGKVVSLLSEEEARKRKKPIVKVSGGGGFYVEGSVNELDREKMKIGQEVTVNDWNTGESYTGKVVSVGDFPVSGYGGMGNPNSSFYPFKAFVDGEANLQAGSMVSLQYSAGGGENGVYLENPFLRTENGRSYVYVMGENDRLEKRYVTTGKSLWGNYTEIRAGLTAEDLVAFPYGKNVKPGAKAKLGDMSDLYG